MPSRPLHILEARNSTLWNLAQTHLLNDIKDCLV